MELASYKYEIADDDKSPDWIKQRMNERLYGLDKSIFSDKKISPDEAITVLNHIGNKNWKREAHAQHVAALQVALKFLDENVDGLDSDPGKIDAMLIKGKGEGKTKGALKKFQEWYNSQDKLNNGNNIDVDGEPGPQSVKALIVAIEHLKSNADVPDNSDSRKVDKPTALTGSDGEFVVNPLEVIKEVVEDGDLNSSPSSELSSSSDSFSSSEDSNSSEASYSSISSDASSSSSSSLADSSESSVGNLPRSEQASSEDTSDGGSVSSARSVGNSLSSEQASSVASSDGGSVSSASSSEESFDPDEVLTPFLERIDRIQSLRQNK